MTSWSLQNCLVPLRSLADLVFSMQHHCMDPVGLAAAVHQSGSLKTVRVWFGHAPLIEACLRQINSACCRNTDLSTTLNGWRGAAGTVDHHESATFNCNSGIGGNCGSGSGIIPSHQDRTQQAPILHAVASHSLVAATHAPTMSTTWVLMGLLSDCTESSHRRGMIRLPSRTTTTTKATTVATMKPRLTLKSRQAAMLLANRK